MPVKYLHSSEDLAQTHDVPLHFLLQDLLCHQLSFHRGRGQVCSGRTAKAPCSSLRLLPCFPCWLAESSSSNTLILGIVAEASSGSLGSSMPSGPGYMAALPIPLMPSEAYCHIPDLYLAPWLPRGWYKSSLRCHQLAINIVSV